MEYKAPRNETEAREQIEAALARLRQAFVDFRRVADFQPPVFILEKQAPAIPAEALVNCRVYPDRESLIEPIPVGGRIAEVGTQHGHWASHLLLKKSPEELHLFDITFDILRQDVRSDTRVRLHAGDSSSALGAMQDQYFDWIYIDADHSYEGVRKDAAAAARKVRRDGVLVFNDYLHWSALEAIPYGVVPCVNEMLASGEWEATGIALTPHGYFDIALRRKVQA
jgi:hypothetical protein